MIRRRFSLLQTIEGINFGHIRMYVTLYRISWIIFTLDSVLNYTKKIVGISMGTNCAPLVADCFYFATKKIS